jgi:hypothetical protein
MIRFAGVNPCPPDTVTPYLNLPAVKAALHARQDIEWIFCRFGFCPPPPFWFEILFMKLNFYTPVTIESKI